MEQSPKSRFRVPGTALVIALIVLWLIQFLALRNEGPQEVPYSQFLSELRAGNVRQAQVGTDQIVATLRRPDTVVTAGGQTVHSTSIETSRIPGVDDTALIDEMQSRGVVFSGHMQSGATWKTLAFLWVPTVLLVALYWVGIQRMSKKGGPISFGKPRTRLYDRNAKEKVTFADVAGVDEAKAELEEVVSFLKDSSKYRALGARIPRGVLLVGPPGTGKTLLARAVAGEANVPFFSLSGSEFVEMFVGVGAARMRALFEQAKQRAPCIVFIDELDAIGKSRSGAMAVATHDEREQTLNQLLVEMDGFDPGKGVIIVGATNRPEVLDQALLRPGRFDRQVLVDRPTVDGRRAILDVHARRVTLAPDVSLDTVAQRTVGMVGADLANVVNEAALAAGRRGATKVGQQDFEEAIDRIQLGLKRRGRVMNDDEKRRVAYHEGGHALVALSVEHADPVHRVTIIPRSVGALGVTLQLPTEDRYLVTRSELRDRVCVMLGGRAAEELIFDEMSTGAHNDLERATETARQMATKFGMSEALGPVTYGRAAGGQFLKTPFDGDERNFSEETARAIDAEVRAIVEEAHDRALAILRERQAVLVRIAERLLERETLERDELEGLLREADSSGTRAALRIAHR